MEFEKMRKRESNTAWNVDVINLEKLEDNIYYQTNAEVREARMEVQTNVSVAQDIDADYVSWHEESTQWMSLNIEYMNIFYNYAILTSQWILILNTQYTHNGTFKLNSVSRLLKLETSVHILEVKKEKNKIHR